MALKINKEKKEVLIYTTKNYKIKGYVHILVNSRLSDSLDIMAKQSQFLPITDAVIVFPDGTRKEVSFLLVRVSSIDLLIQIEE